MHTHTTMFSRAVSRVSQELAASYDTRDLVPLDSAPPLDFDEQELLSQLRGSPTLPPPGANDYAGMLEFIKDAIGLPMYDPVGSSHGIVVTGFRSLTQQSEQELPVAYDHAVLTSPGRVRGDLWCVCPGHYPKEARDMITRAFVERCSSLVTSMDGVCALCGHRADDFVCRSAACRRRAPRDVFRKKLVRWVGYSKDTSIIKLVLGDAKLYVRTEAVTSLTDIFSRLAPHEETAIVNSGMVGTRLGDFCSRYGLYMATPRCVEYAAPFREFCRDGRLRLWTPGRITGGGLSTFFADESLCSAKGLETLKVLSRVHGLSLATTLPQATEYLSMREDDFLLRKTPPDCKGGTRTYEEIWQVSLSPPAGPAAGPEDQAERTEAGGAEDQAERTEAAGPEDQAERTEAGGAEIDGDEVEGAAAGPGTDYDFDATLTGALVEGYRWAVWSRTRPPKHTILAKQLRGLGAHLPGNVVHGPEGPISFKVALEPDTWVIHVLFRGVFSGTEAEILITLSEYANLVTNPRIYPRTATGIWSNEGMACMGTDSNFHDLDSTEPALLHNIISRTILRFSPFMTDDLRGSVGYHGQAFGDDLEKTHRLLADTFEFNRNMLPRTMALFT